MRVLCLVLVGTIFAGLGNLSTAHAAPIVYTHTFQSNGGSLGGNSFGPGEVVITAHANTDDITFWESLVVGSDPDGNPVTADVDAIIHTSATIAIEGVGEFDFITGTETFFIRDFGLAGFAIAGTEPGQGIGVAIGPGGITEGELFDLSGLFVGEGSLENWFTLAVMTTGGVLAFNDTLSTAISLEATAVPIPGAVAFFLTGLAATGFMKRFRKTT